MTVISLLLHDIKRLRFSPYLWPLALSWQAGGLKDTLRKERCSQLLSHHGLPSQALFRKKMGRLTCDAKSADTVLRRGGSEASQKAKLPREVGMASAAQRSTHQEKSGLPERKSSQRGGLLEIRPDQTFHNGCTSWGLRTRQGGGRGG